MIIRINLPDKFVPDEKEFLYYCAIKLLKNNYINKTEAMNIMGINDDNMFNNLYIHFENRYKKIFGNKLSDIDLEE